MIKLELTRKKAFAIFCGFIVIIVIGIITSSITFFVTLNIARSSSPTTFQAAFSQQPLLAINWLLRVLTFISPVIGGIVVGLMVKERGWLYGGILGLVIELISLGFVLLILLLPTSLIYGQITPNSFGQSLAIGNMLNQILYAPMIIILTSLGGWIGEMFYLKSHGKNLFNGKRIFIITFTLFLLAIVNFMIFPQADLSKIKTDNLKMEIPDGKTLTFGTSVNIPKEVPKDLPLYDGKVTSVIADKKQSIIAIETRDDPRTVFNWYKSELMSKKWVITSEDNFELQKDLGNLRFENYEYKGQVTASNRNHTNPDQPTEITRINVSVELIDGSNTIADWNIYTNNRFKVKYPPSWTIEESTNSFTGPTNYKVPPIVSIHVTPSDQFKESDIQNYAPFDYKILENNGYTYLFIANTYQYGVSSQEAENVKSEAIDVMRSMANSIQFL